MTNYPAGLLRRTKNKLKTRVVKDQNLAVYHDEGFADLLDLWGEHTSWPEINILLRERSGRVLDLACGTGKAFPYIANPRLDYHGCDISDTLLVRARNLPIPPENLKIMDATALDYADDEFDYLFSIGSLEHFTEAGLDKTVAESWRVCRGIAFHMVPISRSGINEGWFKGAQSYWNNKESWWVDKFASAYGARVWTMSSKWEDDQSLGRWFICAKN